MRPYPDLERCRWVEIPDLAAISGGMHRALVDRPGARLVALADHVMDQVMGPTHRFEASRVWVHPSDAGAILQWLGSSGSGRCGPESVRLMEIWTSTGFSEWDEVRRGWLAVEPD